jgi:hypothetical protein
MGRGDANDGMRRPGERHRAVLAIAGAQGGQGPRPLASVRDDRGPTAYREKGEGGPILGVVVDDHGDGGVGRDVAHALQREAARVLRLGVHDEIQTRAHARIAERHEVRGTGGIGGREARDAVTFEERPRRPIQNGRHGASRR